MMEKPQHLFPTFSVTSITHLPTFSQSKICHCSHLEEYFSKYGKLSFTSPFVMSRIQCHVSLSCLRQEKESQTPKQLHAMWGHSPVNWTHPYRHTDPSSCNAVAKWNWSTDQKHITVLPLQSNIADSQHSSHPIPNHQGHYLQ
jgi:hypothetical protein